MKKEELIQFIQLLQALDEEMQKELYFMIRGAALSVA